MASLQRCITCSEAAPGMRLSKSVSHVRDHRLFALPAGIELNEQLIQQMMKLEVPCLFVELTETRPVARIRDDEANLDVALQKIFAGANLARPLTREFFMEVRKYRAEHA